MSKELKAFRIMVKDNGLELPYHNTIIAIETALKENQKLTEMLDNDEKLITDLDKKNRLQEQVLRIIKNKGVDVGWLMSCENIEQYNNVIGTATHKLLTQEEFDLLKRCCYE